LADLELVDQGVLYSNPIPGHQVVHASIPFTVQLSSEEFLCVYRRGTTFYSPDSVIAKLRSIDAGRTWQEDGMAWDPVQDGRPYSYSAPGLTSLSDGSLVMVAIRRDHSDPSKLAVNQQTGSFMAVDTLLLRSRDGGRTWSPPEVIQIPSDMIVDVAGPVVELDDSRWFIPFDKGKDYDDATPAPVYMLGLLSSDRGASWSGPNMIASGAAQGRSYFHGRVTKLMDGRLLALLWTRDEASGDFLSLHRVVADPAVEHWSEPEGTALPGQTSWAADVGHGTLVAAYTCREEGRPGIRAALSRDGGSTWDLDGQVELWDASGRETVGQASVTTYPQSHDVIAFGKPVAMRTDDGQVYVSFWATEFCVTQARWARLRVR
jgi:hypothetical protein